jgi:hypothetical protein
LVAYTANASSEFQELLAARDQNATCLSPETQNELIDLIGRYCVDVISKELEGVDFFCLSVDETKDVSHQEQLSITVRFLKDGAVQDRFLGFYALGNLDASSLATKVLDAVSPIVSMKKCVAQVYDGASVMKGNKNGVNAIIKRNYPKALYIHCRNHVLNLCLVDAVSAVKEAEDFFAVLKLLYAFITSSVVHTRFVNVQEEMKVPSEKVKRLKSWPDTRWSCTISAIKAVHATFPYILRTLDMLKGG